MFKKGGKTLFVLGTGLAIGYGVLKSSGLLNKMMYRKECDAVSRYISSHYDGAEHSDIQKTENGYVTILTLTSGERIALSFTQTSSDTFIFSESKI